MVWPEGNMSLKNPVTPPGIDPGIVRLVTQRAQRHKGIWRCDSSNLHPQYQTHVNIELHIPAALTLEKELPVPIEQIAGWARGGLDVSEKR
jgi:hypothetical protein